TPAALRSSGWLIDRSRRLLLTAAQPLAGLDRADVIFPTRVNGEVVVDPTYYRDHDRPLRRQGVIVTGRVLARDVNRQLALLELAAVPADARELSLAAAGPPPGARVHGLGNPNGIDALWVYQTGNVRQRLRTALNPAEPETRVSVLMAQLPVSAGDGGGPLVD